MKEEDKILENWMRNLDEPNFNEAIPEAFLTDINQRLDAMEKGRKRKLGGWIWFSVFFFSAFIAVAAWVGLNKNVNPIQVVNEGNNTVAKGKEKPEETHSEIKNQTLAFEQTKHENPKEIVTSSYKIKPASKENVANIHSNQLAVLEKSEENVEISNAPSENIFVNESIIAQNQALDSLNKAPKLDSVTVKENKEQPTKKKKTISWEAGFSFGVSGIISSFEVPGISTLSSLTYSQEAYRQAREQQERSTTSWDISLRMKMLVNHFTFQSGLDFFQWGEQVKYSFNSISGINRYSYLNFPLNVGYDFRMKKFGFNPFIGTSVGYCFQRNGQYLMPDLEHVSEEKAKQFIGTFTLGTELAYYSESGIKVYVMPIWRKSIGKVVDSGSIFNKYQSLGMQMGVSFRF